MKMREATTRKTYDVWSFFYDHTFGHLVQTRQARAVEQLRLKPGDRVLDIGVGTGMCLQYYPTDVSVTGLDLSGGMLRKAADKCRDQGLDHCSLVRGDAMLPPFAEQSFDHIIITHVISVVSDPLKLMQWAAKLVKPNGRIVVLNHFQSTQPVIAWFERKLNPIFVKIGWRSDLAMEDVLQVKGLDLDYVTQHRMVDIWKIVVMTYRGDASSMEAADYVANAAAPQPASEEAAAVPRGQLAVDAGR